MTWDECKNILCIRADNMGDVIMITPALKAVRQRFNAQLTLLTSSQGAPVCEAIPEIDEVIFADLPWVKLTTQMNADALNKLVALLKQKHFDAAIIFTVYSQSSLPAAMLCYLAEIPLRLAYARENPYNLLTHWIPDPEPFAVVKHQVRRDLDLVKQIGAEVADESLSLGVSEQTRTTAVAKIKKIGADSSKPFLVFHAGVSELKRSYPVEAWKEVLQQSVAAFDTNIFFTGSAGERGMVDNICERGYANVYNLAGLLTVPELIALLEEARVILSVNTAIVHIAAAVKTPVAVLYALTNPQHTPWQVRNRVLTFSVPEQMRSKNEVIRYVDKIHFNKIVEYPTPSRVVAAIRQLLDNDDKHSGSIVEELII